MKGKYDLSKFNNAKSYSIEYFDFDSIVNSMFLKDFRKKMGLTQIRLANILGVTKKAIEKWEQGKNPISGTSARLIYVLNENPELIKTFYKEETFYYVTQEECVDIEVPSAKEWINYKTDKQNEFNSIFDIKWKKGSAFFQGM